MDSWQILGLFLLSGAIGGYALYYANKAVGYSVQTAQSLVVVTAAVKKHIEVEFNIEPIDEDKPSSLPPIEIDAPEEEAPEDSDEETKQDEEAQDPDEEEAEEEPDEEEIAEKYRFDDLDEEETAPIPEDPEFRIES